MCNVSRDDSILLKLLQSHFLKGEALNHYQDCIGNVVLCAEEAIDLLESHYLNHRAKRVNDEVWDCLTYEFVRRQRSARGHSTEHEKTLSDLIERTTDLSDMRTGPGSDQVIMAKTLATVRGVSIYQTIYENPPEKITELNATLRSRALEAGRTAVRSSQADSDQTTPLTFKSQSNIKRFVRKQISNYIDREVRRGRFDNDRRSERIPGYGRSRNGHFMTPSHSPSSGRFNNQQSKPEYCPVCGRKDCKNPNHQRRARSFYVADSETCAEKMKRTHPRTKTTSTAIVRSQSRIATAATCPGSQFFSHSRQCSCIRETPR